MDMAIGALSIREQHPFEGISELMLKIIFYSETEQLTGRRKLKMSRFIICTFKQMLLESSNIGG
jgi:hypothetical protein